MRERKTLYRLPPCPAYDVEGTESWLGDMAREGWHLAPDGIFCGVAQFKRGEPKTVRYRLAAARESTSIWADGCGRPDDEQVETGAELGWEYVANRGQFYIFRTEDPAVRELDTDPQVQALALEEVRKRQRSNLVTWFLWVILYPLFQIRGTVLLSALQLGTPLTLAFIGAILWSLLAAGREYFHLRKMKKRLEEGQPLEHKADWQKKRRWYWGLKGARWVFIVCVLCLLIHAWATWEEGEIPMAEYGGTPPFATFTDLAGEGAVNSRSYVSGKVRAWSDLLSPANLNWSESARVTYADGRILDGALFVDYHETVSPWVARLLAREYYRRDRWGGRWNREQYEPLDCPDLDVDWAVTYRLIFPTVVFRKGNVVVRAYCYGMCLEDWAPILARSVGQ